ncbi:thioesterase II family protein [Kutzneria buriramensis]|uniref:Surfactin synthase thioesterase subunit n=1 Tax=Kutzneria buriramensis TaxID=1045776 RepID=A0A3E0HKJ7_9PSEU|nr:alpha/beta fold hydrolase [Kutzneria buriramensis]REH46937.1 surfactin synthase thioesterase subunit [Kutzneria buriramensis]
MSDARPVVAFIPPSGCGAGYFRRVLRALDGVVECRAVELPGRGRRYREPLLTDADLAVNDLVQRLGGPVDAIYGESLGAYLGLAVAASVEQDRTPVLLAASNAPPCVRGPVGTGEVDSVADAVAGLAALGGASPSEVVEDALPLLRSDLYLSRSLITALCGATVSANIWVLAGEQDAGLVRPEAWAEHTTAQTTIIRLTGEHLLSATNPAGVAQVVQNALAQ